MRYKVGVMFSILNATEHWKVAKSKCEPFHITPLVWFSSPFSQSTDGRKVTVVDYLLPSYNFSK